MNWKKLRPARLEAAISQEDLAAELSITQASVSRFESGKLPASAETVAKILRAIERLDTTRKR